MGERSEKEQNDDGKLIITPAELKEKDGGGEEQEEESSSDEDADWEKRPTKKSAKDMFLEKQQRKKDAEKKTIITPANLKGKASKFEELKNKANLKVELPVDNKPTRRRKKVAIEEEQVSLFDEPQQESAPSIEEETEIALDKDKVRDHFPERSEKEQNDDGKLIIRPAELEEKDGEEEEQEEESSSDEDADWEKRPTNKSAKDVFLEKQQKKKDAEKKTIITPANLKGKASKFEEL